MKYNIKAHPTKYRGVQFRSRLEARWATFFDLAEWQWKYEPIDLVGWSPDFEVTFPCRHSECSGSHTLLVEVKPYQSIDQFKGHPCMDYGFGFNDRHGEIRRLPADASAAFGLDPGVSYWEMSHGAGGASECIENWVLDWQWRWVEAGNQVQYQYKTNR